MSTVSVLAVSITIGTPDSMRSSRQISRPSLPGSIRSSSTRSGLAWWNAAIALSPERTNTGSKPSCLRTMPSISPRDGSSSTTRTLPRKRLASSHRQPAKDAMTLGRRGVPRYPQSRDRSLTGSGAPTKMRAKTGMTAGRCNNSTVVEAGRGAHCKRPGRRSRSEMNLVGSSPPPQGPDEGAEAADSPNADDRDAALPRAPGEEDSGWVAPGAPTGPEPTGTGAPPAPDPPSPGSAPPSPGWGPPSQWSGWGEPPGRGSGPPSSGQPPSWSGGGEQPAAWGPAPQPAWGGAAGWGTPGYEPPALLPKAGSARTGPLPLHPMSFSDVLDGAFRLLRANLATIVLVTAVFFVPLELISAFLSRDLFGGQSLLQVLQDPSLAEQDFGGGLSQVVAASYLGRQLSAGDAIRTTGRRVWALLGAAIFVHVIEAVGFVLCVLPALVVMTFLICTTPAVVIEWLGPVKSMRRSLALVRPRFWPVLGIAVVSGLLATFLKGVLSTPFTLGAELVGFRWGFILLAIGSIVPALVASPFVSIVATLVYFDARIRHEGFDLQMIARGLADGDASAR